MMFPSHEIDVYLEGLTEDRRIVLTALRGTVHRIWPEIEERLVSGIPHFFLLGNMLIGMADRKNYIAVYVGPYDLLNAFKSDLRVYDHGRSCIRSKRLDPPLMELLERIVRYTGAQLHTSKFFKQHREGPALLDQEETSIAARMSV